MKYADPLSHPNFEFPATPEFKENAHDIYRAIDWACEAAARMISPPKVSGENEEFACEDVAALIRGKLRASLRNRLQQAYPRPI